MEIKRIGSQPSGKGPADWFTGTVRIDPLFEPPAPARASGASVTFEPGARTAWHTHPLGQTLIVTAGCGWAAGVERILLASEGIPGAPVPVELYVAYVGEDRRPEAFALTMSARRAGLNAQLELAGRSLKGQLKQADRVGARFLAILGDDGAELKDMESGEQRPVDADALVREVLRGRGIG